MGIQNIKAEKTKVSFKIKFRWLGLTPDCILKF